MTQPSDTNETPTTNAPEASSAQDNAPLREGGVKALQAERDARKAVERELAALKPLADKARELEEAGKSELEKLTERLTAAEKAAEKASTDRARLAVALEKGLPAALVTRLQGSTEDELRADADALLSLIPQAPQVPTTPKPDPSQGARGAAATDIDARIAKAEADGDFRTAIALKARKSVPNQ